MIGEFAATGEGRFSAGNAVMRCALGRAGVAPYEAAHEGDGASPIGRWPMRRVFYRPDRLAPPETTLSRVPLAPHDGWCDAPGDVLYNRPVSRPYPVSHEALWREDHVYDIIVELGFNDDPVVPGKGSAIFLHLAHDDYRPTEGCIALALPDLLEVLRRAAPGAHLTIER